MSSHVEERVSDYDKDFFQWSESQARLLKSMRSMLDSLPEGLDLDIIAEEIEDLGKAELHSVESQVQNIFVHLLKAASDPKAPALGHWRTESSTFYAELVRKYSPSMRQRLDLDKAWRLAIRVARDALREHGRELAAGVPATPPFSIDDLVSDDFDFDRSFERLASGIVPKTRG